MRTTIKKNFTLLLALFMEYIFQAFWMFTRRDRCVCMDGLYDIGRRGYQFYAEQIITGTEYMVVINREHFYFVLYRKNDKLSVGGLFRRLTVQL